MPKPANTPTIESDNAALRPQRPLNQARLGLTLTALAVALLLASQQASAQAGSTQSNNPAVPIAIQQNAQPLDRALTAIAARTGILIGVDAGLVRDKQAPALNGSYTPEQALAALLTGSGLEAGKTGEKSYTIRPGGPVAAPAPKPAVAAQSDRSLTPVTVTESAEVLGEKLATPFAGGELARGATLGVLGQRDLFELPISVKAFTAQSVLDQIAFTSNDVLSRDASFTTNNSANINGSTAGTLRGFRLEPFESTYDGFSSIASRRYSLESLERVEILKGPTTIFTGAIGGVGGTVNYVSKKPLETPLSRVTLGYFENAQYGAHVDLSRRFGVDNALGLRVNLAHRNGETAVDELDEKSQVAHIAFNWRNEIANLDVQYGHLDERIQGASGGYFFGGGIPIGRPPEGAKVSGPDWDQRSTRDEFLRAALDVKLAQGWSAFGVLGSVKNRERFLGLGQNVLNASGDASGDAFVQNGDAKGRSLDVGLRGKFSTGPVGHAVTLSYFHTNNRSKFQDAGISPTFIQPRFNIYDPASLEGPGPEIVGSGQFFPFSESTYKGVVLADEMSLLQGRLLLTAGLRQTRIEIDRFSFGAPTPGGLPNSRYSASDTSPSLGILYKLTPRTSVYGNYLRAIEAGSIAPVQAVNAGDIIPPGVATQKEVGVKLDLGEVGVTTALFSIERPSTYIDPISRVFGAFGLNRHQGLEIDVFGEPFKGVKTQLSYLHLDPKIRQNQNPALVGNTPVSVPSNVLVLSADAAVPALPGLAVLAGMRFVDKQFYDLTNQRSIPSFAVFDLGARYSFRTGGTPLVLRLNMTNVFDKNYFQSADFTAQTGAPRTLRATLQADF